MYSNSVGSGRKVNAHGLSILSRLICLNLDNCTLWFFKQHKYFQLYIYFFKLGTRIQI